MRSFRKFILVTLFLGGAALVTAATSSADGNDHKITICHASGQADTTKFETLTVGWNAVYGPGGHFNENGTTQAGHEQDYLGKCKSDDGGTTTTEPDDETTVPTTSVPDDTTTTTVPENPPVVTKVPPAPTTPISVDKPVVDTTVAPPASEMPVTGFNTLGISILAALVVGVGLALAWVTKNTRVH